MHKRALTMLAASLAMVIETACSHAPAPATTPAEKNEKILTKIYTTDNTLYVTSRYAVTDSFVVIHELIRDQRYYPYEHQAHLYEHDEPYTMPKAGLDLPVMIPVSQVKRIEPWTESHETRDGVLAGAGIFVGLIVGVLMLLAASDPFKGLD
jgi:hypothetical protein